MEIEAPIDWRLRHVKKCVIQAEILCGGSKDKSIIWTSTWYVVHVLEAGLISGLPKLK